MDTPPITPAAAKIHPLFIAAAIALIVFAAAGTASMLGWLPSIKAPSPTPTATESTTPVQAAAPQAAPPGAAPAAPAVPTAADKPAISRPTHSHAAAPVKHTPKAETPVTVCHSCGVISAIRTIEQQGEGSGLGAVAGGVTGALLGHQIGGGTGKDIATIAGAVGGAYTGNQIEKNVKKSRHYEINVRMEDGTYRVINQATEPAFAIGDKVKIIDGHLELN